MTLGQSKSILHKKISVEIQKLTFTQALEQIEKASGAFFIYQYDDLPRDKKVTLSAKDQALSEVLRKLFSFTRLSYEASGEEITIKKVIYQTEEQLFTISGKVYEKTSKEAIFGVNVYEGGLKSGTSTNQFGFYSLSFPKGTYRLVFSSIGYVTHIDTIQLTKDIIIDIELDEEDYLLDTVDIGDNEIAARREHIEDLNMSTVSVNPAIIKQNPPFFGESDPLKTMQLYPGIQNGGEGNTGIFVRGGAADQNLVLLDGAPLYNSTHFLGFFSIFNPEAVKEIEVYKGGLPAKYGGRLSSVVDLRTKEGNKKETILSGGIGNLASRLTFEKPIAGGKGSILLAGRRTYVDLLLKLVPDNTISRNDVSFHDSNFKLNYRPNNKNEFSFSGYWGSDKVILEKLFGTKWVNRTATFRWNHIFSPKLFSNTTFIASNFQAESDVSLVADEFGYLINYSLTDWGIKQDFTYFLDPYTQFDFGFEATYHRYLFGEILPSNPDSKVTPQSLDPNFALETGIYGSLEIDISPRITAQLGLRVSRFDNIGKASIYRYDTEDVISPNTTIDNIVDTLRLNGQGSYHHYVGLEPRIALRYKLNTESSIKLSYNRTRQYIHQLSNTNTPSPVDMWAPVNPYIKPQIGDQLAVGYFRHILGNHIEISAESYIKYMQNQIDFKSQASLLRNDHLETEILSGEGLAYGLELLARKQAGKLSGWVSYTLSRSVREINGINNGNPYPTSFDRRHNFVTVLTYKFTDRISLSANWVYASGIAYSFPVGKYEINGVLVPYYTNRNGFRLPDTHRLDLALTVFREMNEERTNESSFSFSIYNVYARKNTYAFVFRQEKDNPNKTETVKLFLFSIVPSFTYNFRF